MTTGRVNMQNSRNTILIQSQIIIHSISGRNSLIIITINDKSTRCFFCHLLLIRILLFQLSRSILTQKAVMGTHVSIRLIHCNYWIEKNLEIRTKFWFGMSRDCRCKMSAGRRSHDTDISWIQIPYISTVPHYLHGSLGIRNRKCTVTIRHTIFQNDQCDTLFVEIRCPIISFVVYSQVRISTTRARHYSTTCSQFRRRKKYAKRRLFNIKRVRSILSYRLRTCEP